MIEIERKFLVRNEQFKAESRAAIPIAQGYLSSVPERTVRVRIKGNQGFLTIKGKSNASGASRLEWEKEITVAEAQMLLPLCEKGTIQKTRYEVVSGQHIIEVDVFEGENAGLILAEIELQSEDETYAKPDWLGEEVTHDARYYNAYLSQHPFGLW
ncbi:CYTH domain-containing protein [Flavobacterium fontis]|uniref:CYTH domain-containing protein n=1 Tax=Flavobacterium fontis TaxID=1124188 RepID=A0A1M4YDI6_9FLAO|nr:CYTH domain-containing protein [Flavobacterium fontis]SHF03698.1 CYTH domain-containing protein [Flavobacterium fontis]